MKVKLGLCSEKSLNSLIFMCPFIHVWYINSHVIWAEKPEYGLRNSFSPTVQISFLFWCIDHVKKIWWLSEMVGVKINIWVLSWRGLIRPKLYVEHKTRNGNHYNQLLTKIQTKKNNKTRLNNPSKTLF